MHERCVCECVCVCVCVCGCVCGAPGCEGDAGVQAGRPTRNTRDTRDTRNTGNTRNTRNTINRAVTRTLARGDGGGSKRGLGSTLVPCSVHCVGGNAIGDNKHCVIGRCCCCDDGCTWGEEARRGRIDVMGGIARLEAPFYCGGLTCGSR